MNCPYDSCPYRTIGETFDCSPYLLDNYQPGCGLRPKFTAGRAYSTSTKHTSCSNNNPRMRNRPIKDNTNSTFYTPYNNNQHSECCLNAPRKCYCCCCASNSSLYTKLMMAPYTQYQPKRSNSVQNKGIQTQENKQNFKPISRPIIMPAPIPVNVVPHPLVISQAVPKPAPQYVINQHPPQYPVQYPIQHPVHQPVQNVQYIQNSQPVFPQSRTNIQFQPQPQPQQQYLTPNPKPSVSFHPSVIPIQSQVLLRTEKHLQPREKTEQQLTPNKSSRVKQVEKTTPQVPKTSKKLLLSSHNIDIKIANESNPNPKKKRNSLQHNFPDEILQTPISDQQTPTKQLSPLTHQPSPSPSHPQGFTTFSSSSQSTNNMQKLMKIGQSSASGLSTMSFKQQQIQQQSNTSTSHNQHSSSTSHNQQINYNSSSKNQNIADFSHLRGFEFGSSAGNWGGREMQPISQ